VFNFPNDIIAIDPIRIRLWQMSQNEYLVWIAIAGKNLNACVIG